jgi:chemotaxis protein MotA
MDIATIAGLTFGLLLILAAIILGGSALVFINIPGILIVIGGTIAVTFVKFSVTDVINTISVVMKTFLVRLSHPSTAITQLAEFASLARKDGVLALEGKTVEDAFFARGLRMIIDGLDREHVETVLRRELQYTVERHKKGKSIFKGMGSSAPAFGMIGTLIGLVQMLASMEDPSKIGPAMAVALLTTLYGAILANLIAMPLADKLDLRSKEETLLREVIIAGISGIQEGVQPRLLEEQLKMFLAPKTRGQEEKAAA